MEAMRKLTDMAFPSVLSATREAFVPLLAARKAQIASTPKKTFKYGATDRHQLDVYYPSSKTTSAPILFFAYGGGFSAGSRDIVPGLLYDNIGAFFAQRGILTIIPDYRLVPETVYPGASHDVHEAVRFVLNSKIVDVASCGGDKTRVYIMGHSAGAAIATTLFLNEDLMRAEERAIFKGAVLLGGGHSSMPLTDGYYGEPKEDISNKTPLGLLRSKSPEQVKQLLPPLFILVGGRDVDFILEWDAEFKKTLREKAFTDFQEYTMTDHNHISTYFAISSGEGEDWAEEVAKWIKG